MGAVVFGLMSAVDYGMFGAIHRPYGDGLLFCEKMIDPRTRPSGKRESLVFWKRQALDQDLVLRKAS
ncbi:hypothetical protein TNCV_2853401 [Trichonephila clavipes]|uniref:Uncharacterized protein n=1 Tax=Trichonephila clavipes TaxID=2585209 RepID=A0A8X6REP2_TRICX|nr:hypothetical protein TNCV_2853401 [Trichonephila clavipes]